MKRRWDYIAICGLVLATLVFLIGDNILGRLFSAGPTEVVKVPADKEIALTLSPTPSEVPSPSPSAKSLLARVCAAKAFQIDFKTTAADPQRFRRRSGSVLVPIYTCSEYSGQFETKVRFVVDGFVAGDRVEFGYSYIDDSGSPDCHVTATITNSETGAGRMFCEAEGPDLEVRPAQVSLR